jgi:hypothetical protein
MPHVHEYWLTDAHGVVRDSNLRVPYDDDAVAALKAGIISGELGPFHGVISVVRDDGDVIDSWDGVEEVGK